MNKRDFFIKALQNNAQLRTAWVISAFSLIAEAPDAWKGESTVNRPNNYPYRIVQTPTAMFFVNPENTSELIKIEDAVPNEPIFKFDESLEVDVGDLPSIRGKLKTTYGNFFFNAYVLVYAFGGKIQYQNTAINARKLEGMLVDILKDTPEDSEQRSNEFIYVDEFRLFLNAMFALTSFTQLCVPGVSEKSITVPPGGIELRDRLLRENKDKLHDASVVADIDRQLVNYIREYLKGDESLKFLTDKSFVTVRKKTLLMIGADQTLDDRGPAFSLVTNSLAEGWKIQDLPALATGARSGSFNRGAQTELGGEAVKWLFRAASNLRVTIPDCGTTMGNWMVAAPGDEYRLLGFSVIDEGKTVKVDKSNVGTYMGKRVLVRSPMFCKSPKTDFCQACASERLANLPTALPTAVSAYGDVFMLVFMSSMHDTALRLAKLDPLDCLI